MTESDIHSRAWFRDSLLKNPTQEEFANNVGQLLTESERKFFGENAITDVGFGLMLFGALAPSPATFDIQAYASLYVINEHGFLSLSVSGIARLIHIAIQGNILKPIENRFMLDAQVAPILADMLEQQNSNPFEDSEQP